MDVSKYDALDDFEKQLAQDKAERDQGKEKGGKDSRKEKHRHQHRHRHHRSRQDVDDGRDRHDNDRNHEHRHKRSKHSDSRHRHEHVSSEKEPMLGHKRHVEQPLDERNTRLPVPDPELPQSPGRTEEPEVSHAYERDSWMTAPSALDIDYTQRGQRVEKPKAPVKPDYDLKIHKNELNVHLQDLADGRKLEDLDTVEEVDYTFGDAGSQWRMTKLKAVYTQADATGRSIDDIAEECFGSLQKFDDAREEEVEVGRRKVYGNGYIGKEKPSGDLYRERRAVTEIQSAQDRNRQVLTNPSQEQGQVMANISVQPATNMDQTGLNKLRAQMMKAKLMNKPDASRLAAEYDKAAAAFASNKSSDVIVLNHMENRMLAGPRGEVKAVDNKRGRERGTVVENEDMSIEDMVREERRTRGQAGGEGQRFAERIAKDAKYDDNLDYMDENADKLAKRVHRSEINLKNSSIAEFQKMNRVLDNCQLCHHEDTQQPPVAPVVSLATRVFLTLPTEPELSDGGAVIAPIQHRTNLVECDDDEWEEIRNFMKSLTRMYHDQGRSVIFYENAALPRRKLHAAMNVVPLPYELGDTVSAFFREGMLSADEEWSQHKKIIDTGKMARDGAGKGAFRRAIAKEMPYFHVWTELDGGLGHIVEDEGRWPRGDLFAREIVGGMLDCEPDVIRKQGRWNRGGDSRVEPFRKRWRKFDWTRILTDTN